MNRTLLLSLLALCLLFILPGCGGNDDDDTVDDDDDDSAPGDDDDSAAAPGDDDDSAAAPGDDDDSAAAPGDDDDSAAAPGDDDDSAAAPGDDDDSGAAPCTGPENIVVSVELFDQQGAVSTTLSTSNPLLLSVTVENLGGVATPHWFNNGCLTTWTLTSPTAQVVDYGPICTSVMMQRTFTCPQPVSGGGSIDAWDDNQAALSPGIYDLAVTVAPFGVTNVAVTVP